MSDETTTITDTTTQAPKAKQKRAPRKDVPLSSCHVKYGAAKGIDVTRAAKQNRSYMRTNFDTLVKQWPALKTSGKQNADNMPWPSTIPAELAEKIVKRQLAKAAK